MLDFDLTRYGVVMPSCVQCKKVFIGDPGFCPKCAPTERRTYPSPDPDYEKAPEHVKRTLKKAAEKSLEVVPGEPCPVCGKKVALTAAEYQRRYRERKKIDASKAKGVSSAS